MKQIAILASGSGSNAEVIIRNLHASDCIRVACVLTNKETAGVRERAQRLGVEHYYFTNAEMVTALEPLKLLRSRGVSLVVLAGYLNLISPPWLEAFPQRILNIHPALLPAYGGKGMYGDNVHRAVLEAGEAVSGITIHTITEHYDEGRYLLQASCPVLPEDTPETLAGRIHALEHRYYTQVIEHYLQNEL